MIPHIVQLAFARCISRNIGKAQSHLVISEGRPVNEQQPPIQYNDLFCFLSLTLLLLQRNWAVSAFFGIAGLRYYNDLATFSCPRVRRARRHQLSGRWPTRAQLLGTNKRYAQVTKLTSAHRSSSNMSTVSSTNHGNSTMHTFISTTRHALAESVPVNGKPEDTLKQSSWSKADLCYMHTLRKWRRGHAKSRPDHRRRTRHGVGVGMDPKILGIRYDCINLVLDAV
jgi:hypothetical protein